MKDGLTDKMDTNVEESICELLMQSKGISTKFWNLMITNRGLHLIIFKGLPLFEIITLLFVWVGIFFFIYFCGPSRIALVASFLFLIALIYFLDKHRVSYQWEKFKKLHTKQKIFSDSRNVHYKISDIRKIFVDDPLVVISTYNKTYKLIYYQDGNSYYKVGKDPFRKTRIEVKKKELDINKFFGMYNGQTADSFLYLLENPKNINQPSKSDKI